MAGIGSFFLALATAVATFFGFRAPPPPCSAPIAYSVGHFDRRFGVSYADFVSALKEAEAVWEAPSGKDLFAYDPARSILPVNLVYDYRQEATEKLSSIASTVTHGTGDYHALETEYSAAKANYDSAAAAYQGAVTDFNTKNAEYQAEVDAWNRSPRTSQEQFQALDRARQALEAQAAALKAQQDALNAQVDSVNALAERLNALAKSLNLDVKQYNAIGASRGEEFTGGLYVEDASGQHIDIYEFSAHEKLVRVLAHELGHALGFDHVSDPKAIMNAVNEGKGTAATAADLAELDKVCNIKQ